MKNDKTFNITKKLLMSLVEIPSVFPDEYKLSIIIENFLKSLKNCSVKRVKVSPKRHNLVATIGNSRDYICFYGHMDTVPPDPLWNQNPFSVEVEGEVAKGLGVADMKGGIASILLVAKYASENNLAIKVCLGVDEENLSLGSHILVKNSFFNDVIFIISAESGQVIDINQSFTVNYGRKGRFVLECMIKGTAAHAARSDIAVNAIIESAKFISQIKKIRQQSHPQLGKTEIIPFCVNSITDSFSIPDLSYIKLNVLTIPGTKSEDVIKKLEEVAKKNNINAEIKIMERKTPYMESYQIDRDSRAIKTVEKIFEEYGVIPGYAASVADENRFANQLKIPVISMGPVGGDDHTHKEWVNIKSIETTSEAYVKIIKAMSN